MARPTISQRIALEGGDQIKRALADLGKAGEDAFAQLQRAGEKVNLSGPVSALEASTKRAGATVDELRQRMTGAGGAAAQSGAGFAQFGGAVQTTQQRLVAAVNVGARVGLALQGVGTAFSGAFGKVREFGDGVTGVLQSMGSTVLKSAAALTAVPAAFFAIATSAANAASQIKEASIAAGTSPQEYQKLTIAAEQMGGSEEKLVLALSAINEKVQEQSQNFFGNQQRLEDLRTAMLSGGFAGRQAAVDFEKLRREMDLFGPSGQRGGQSIIDVDKALKSLGPSNRDAIERLKGFADEISALSNPAERSARVVEIFGRRLGPQLVELLSGGRKAIEDIGKRAEGLGLIMSNTEFKVAKDMNDALALMRRSIGATKNSIGLLFAPAIIDAAELFTEAIARNRTDLILWASEIAAKVRPVLLDLVRALTGDTEAITTGWIRTARQLIVDLGAAIANVTQTVIIPAFQAFVVILQTVAETINGIFGTKLTAADIGVVLLLAKMVGAFTLLAGVLRLVGGAFGALRVAFAILAGARQCSAHRDAGARRRLRHHPRRGRWPHRYLRRGADRHCRHRRSDRVPRRAAGTGGRLVGLRRARPRGPRCNPGIRRRPRSSHRRSIPSASASRRHAVERHSGSGTDRLSWHCRRCGSSLDGHAVGMAKRRRGAYRPVERGRNRGPLRPRSDNGGRSGVLGPGSGSLPGRGRRHRPALGDAQIERASGMAGRHRWR